VSDTHDVDLPASVYDQVVNSPIAMMNLALFDDMVSEDDWVRVRCHDDDRSSVGRITGVAAVLEWVQTPSGEPGG
jgi:hypothetical protein